MVSNSARSREYAALGVCGLTVPLAYLTCERSFSYTLVLLLLAFIWTGTSSWLSGQWRWLAGKSWHQLRAGYRGRGDAAPDTDGARPVCRRHRIQLRILKLSEHLTTRCAGTKLKDCSRKP